MQCKNPSESVLLISDGAHDPKIDIKNIKSKQSDLKLQSP